MLHAFRPVARTAGIAMLAALALGAAARAEVPESAYASVNRALTDGVVIPGYEKLAGAAAAFHRVVDGYCTGDKNADVDPVHQAYHDTTDAWMRVQPIGVGPVELFMRNFRLHFWPSGGGRVEKAVDEILAGSAPITTAGLGRASVAAQGLPAAELLLFGDRASDLQPGSRRCAFLRAIAGNLANIAAAVVADWKGGKIDFRRKILAPGKDNPYFVSAEEASLAYFKSLYQALELIVAAKLGPVAGGTAKKGAVADMESARSGRSLRNMVLNLETAQALYLGPKDDGFTAIVRAQTADAKLDPLMRRAFRLTLETARSIRPPLARALADPAQRKTIDKLLLQTRALKQIIATRLAEALGLAVGFNARDGD